MAFGRHLYLFTKNRTEPFDGITNVYKVGDHAAHRELDRSIRGAGRTRRIRSACGGIAVVSWTVVWLLTAGVMAQRLFGMFAGGALLARVPALARLASLIPAAVVAAVIVQLTVASGASLVLDARLAGVAVAGVLVWRRAPFVVVIVAAAMVTALLRL